MICYGITISFNYCSYEFYYDIVQPLFKSYNKLYIRLQTILVIQWVLQQQQYYLCDKYIFTYTINTKIIIVVQFKVIFTSNTNCFENICTYHYFIKKLKNVKLIDLVFTIHKTLIIHLHHSFYTHMKIQILFSH